jgi:hypothetical protein
VICWLSFAYAQSLSGFAEVRGTVHAGVDGQAWEMVERVRPTFEAEVSDRVLVATTVEAGIHQGRTMQTELERTVEESALGPMFTTLGMAWPDPPANEALRLDDAGDYLSVERLYADVYLNAMDIRVGRQALNWGSATFLNPTSPFPELLVTEPWKFRRGVNAARVTIPIKERHQVQAVLATDDLMLHPRAALRGQANIGTTDIGVIGAYRGDADNGLVGLDVRGTFGVGFWFEGAAHLGGGGDVYEELATGIDYSFPVFQRFLVVAQYYRNGAGATDVDDYALTGRISDSVELPNGADALFPSDEGIVDPFAPPLLAQNYVFLALMSTLIDELSVNLAVLDNVDDGTGAFIPTVSVLPTGWLDITATAQVPYKLYGEGGEFKPREADLIVGDAPMALDMSGLLPDASVSLWVRASF